MSSEEPDKQDPDPPKVKNASGPQSKRYFPDIRWIVVWLILIGGVIFLHLASEKIEDVIPAVDQAVRNLVAGLALLVIPFTMIVWFSFFSDNGTRKIRLYTFFGFAGFQALVIFFTTTCVEFDGDMTPVAFHWPGQKAKDYQLDAPPETNSAVDLKTETPDDFPQFLGPNRDGKLSGTYFAYDWITEKPKLLWKRPIGPGHSGFATRNGFAVTMEQRGDQELTTCYDIQTGELKWSYAENTRHHSWLGKLGPRSTPTIFDGFVYCLGGNGHLACLDGSTGELVWKKDLFQEFGTSIQEEKNTVTWGRAASPLVFDDKVVVPAGGPKNGPYVSLVCYQRKTGRELWRAGETQISYASPMLMNYLDTRVGFARCIVSVNESNVTAHEPSSGEMIWWIDRPGNSTSNASTSQPVTLPGSQLLLTKGYGLGATKVQYQGGVLSTSWINNRVLKTKFTNAVYHHTYAFALSDGRLECVDLRNGKQIWKSRKSYGHGQILLCGSEILVLAEKGYVALVRAWGATEEQEVSRDHVQFTSFQALDGTSWNTLAVHGNKLLVRNSQEAACYEMPIRYRETE